MMMMMMTDVLKGC